jgi:two-component system, LytTR family, sensor kinase
MQLAKRHKRLIRISGIINLFLLLLILACALYIATGHKENQRMYGRMAAFASVNVICWIVNVAIAVLLAPVIYKWRNSRLNFFLSSYLITVPIAYLLSSVVIRLSQSPPLEHSIGAFMVVLFCNTSSFLAIALILSTYERDRVTLENAALKNINLQAQHEKLKHQLQPHFLFNSLNALKTLIRRDPEQAESYLIKLSEFLRFSISYNEQNIVPLKEELRFSQYYLEMQKTRFQDSLLYEIDIPATMPESASLPVFSLQLLLENAIKHNVFTRHQPLMITVRYQAPDVLMVENNIASRTHTGEGSTGLGLKNLSERYQLLTQQDIRITADENYFRVYLKII